MEFLKNGLQTPRLARIAPDLVGAEADDRTYLVVMGIYPIPDPSVPVDSDSVIIAPFAAFHYYRSSVKKLKGLVSALRRETGIAKRHIRVFSNSRLPERPIAAALGMGWVGRNGLLMNREYGSSFVLAGLLAALDEKEMEQISGCAELPLISKLDAPDNPHWECGSCRACVTACPTGAIKESGGVNLSRCLQYLTTSTDDLPDFALEVWGRRLYGCQECQNCCPVNRGRTYRAVQDNPAPEEYPAGELLQKLSSQPAPSLKETFPDTALEASWIPREAILRNLLIAAGNSGNKSLIPQIRLFLNEENPLIAHAAACALDKILKG